MGTLLRIDGFRVMIYTNDHAPAHVHLISSDGRAKIALNCPTGPAIPIDVRGIDSRVLKKVLPDINQHLLMLCQEWGTKHGAY